MFNGDFYWYYRRSRDDSWIYNQFNQCLSSLKLSSSSNLDHVLKFVNDRWFYPGTPVSFTNKTDRHNITEILLKLALNNLNYFYVAKKNCSFRR